MLEAAPIAWCNVRRPAPKSQSPQLCFHFASRFRGTLRLAHMLYSLARVSRRDRWGWTDHHSDCSPDSDSPNRDIYTAWYRPSPAKEYARTRVQTRMQLVARGSYQNVLGYACRPLPRYSTKMASSLWCESAIDKRTPVGDLTTCCGGLQSATASCR